MLPPTYVEGFHDEQAVKRMKYNKFGNTDMVVSHLGFGCGPFGGSYGELQQQEANKCLREALRQGVNYIDTAPFYGEGKSEEVLGKALQGIPREAYYVATKVGRYKMNIPDMFDFSAKRTLQSVDESLAKLGVSYVDLIQVHDIEFAPSLDIILQETLPALESVVRAGKARYIGINGYPLGPLTELAGRYKGPLSSVLSYCRASLLDQQLSEHLPGFQSRGLGVINAGLVCLGLLTSKGPQIWHPCYQSIKDVCKQAADYCKDQGVEIAKLAVHYSFNFPGPQTHLIGCISVDEVKNNLNTLLEGLTPKEQQVLDEMQEKFFKSLTVRNWEGAEVKNYWETMEKLGKGKR